MSNQNYKIIKEEFPDNNSTTSVSEKKKIMRIIQKKS
jgi:hypothetical protein